MGDYFSEPEDRKNCGVRRYLGAPRDDAAARRASSAPSGTGASGEPSRSSEPCHPEGPADCPPPGTVRPANREEPFVFDLAFVLSSAWRYRTPVLAGAVVFALVGGALTSLLPKVYSAAATLYFDPQKFAVDVVSEEKVISSEVFNATIDSQTRIITSYSVLEDVAKNLKLGTDPEFLGKLSGDPAVDFNTVLATLVKRIEVSRQDGTFIFQIKVKAGEPHKAADIANALVTAYLKDARFNAESSYETANEGLSQRLGALRQAVIDAEAAARDYRAKNDLYSVGGDMIADTRLQSLDELLVAAQHKTIAAKAQLDTVSKLDIGNVLVADPSNVNASRTLADLRNQYATQSANVSSLTQRLGSRHPQLQAAQASLGDIKNQISGELSRMVAASRSAYQAAQREEADLLKQINIQKASQATSSSSLIELSELERKAKAARDIYEAVLKRTEETAAQKNLYESNVRIVSQAVPAQAPDGPSRKILFLAGVFGGAVFGFGLAVLAAVGRALYLRTR